MTVAISVPAVIPYIGNDLADTFAVVFPTYENENVKALVAKTLLGPDEDPVEIDLILGTDFTLSNIGRPNQQAVFKLKDAADVPDDWVGAIPPSQEWLTSGKLATNYTLFISFSTFAQQPARFRGFGDLTPEQFEKVVDRLTMNIKALKAEVDRALKLSQAAFEAGEESDAGALLARVTALEEELAAFLESGAGLPPGALDGEFLEGDTMDPVGAVWKSGSYDGISALTGGQFTSTGLKDTLDKIIRITNTPPAINLSTGASTAIREKGTVVSTVPLTANYQKRTNNIGSVRIFRAGALVFTLNPAVAGGGSVNYTDNTAFSDNMSFQATVTDLLENGYGPNLTNSNTINFSFVYPYYMGAGVTGKTPAQVAMLTKAVVASNNNYNVGFTAANGDVFYFAYPASYGALTSILDINNFETFNANPTLSDWALTTANITGLDGTAVSYRIYVFKNPVVAGSTSYTFKR